MTFKSRRKRRVTGSSGYGSSGSGEESRASQSREKDQVDLPKRQKVTGRPDKNFSRKSATKKAKTQKRKGSDASLKELEIDDDDIDSSASSKARHGKRRHSKKDKGNDNVRETEQDSSDGDPSSKVMMVQPSSPTFPLGS